MTQPGPRAADGPDGGRATGLDPASTIPDLVPPVAGNGPPDGPVADAVRRTDLHRARQAALGGPVRPDAARFAAEIARAVTEAPARAVAAEAAMAGGAAPAPPADEDAGLPELRDAVFGSTPTPTPLRGAESLRLPDVPAAVCDLSDRILRVNEALLRLAGEGVQLFNKRLRQLVVGPEADARLVRGDGGLVRVRVVRWTPPGEQLTVVAFVELDDSGAAARERAADRSWTEELERIARVGTWSYELGSRSLHRSETLEELYRSVGIDPDGAMPERELVAALVEGLRSGRGAEGRHVELRLPGDLLLSCRAEIEYAGDGSPVRLVGVVRDVSAQRRAAGQARHSGQRFADLMALLPVGVALLDAAGRIVEANDGMCQLLDAAPGQLHGMAAAALAAESSAGAWPAWLRPVPPGAQYGYHVAATPLRRRDGTSVWCELDVAITVADDGSRLWLLVATDVTDRRRAAEVLRSAGTVDELTRLPNRSACLDLLDRLLAGPGRERVGVVCGGLDGFQRINSSLGHDAGDDVLVTLAARLQRELPVGCTPARLSGDEFVVVCADHADLGGPDQLARLVAGLLRTTVTVRGRPVPVTASVGLATAVPSGDLRAADLLRFAEMAMHDVKRRQSRGGIGVATRGIVSSAARALEMEAELRAAIDAGGLAQEFQPVVGPDGRVLSLEALVRWPHPERGTIPPSDFLPVAQRCGLLRDLDLWVLRTATAEAATWPAHGGTRPAVAVNLAGLLPGDPYFSDAVTRALESAGLPWDRLVLELVETSLVALPPHALAAMQRLTERGVRFAVDDFGTGYSSLARLKELPAQTVKVDRAFVTGVADDPVDFAVARAVVDMARAMGRTTVAEGVETAEQFHVLRGIGVDAFQGWLFSRPLPPAEVRSLLARGRLATPAAARHG